MIHSRVRHAQKFTHQVFFSAAMLFAICVEFLVHITCHKYPLGLDIVLLLYTSKIGFAPSNIALLCIGTFRDSIYLAPAGGTSLLYLLVNVMLHKYNIALSRKTDIVVATLAIYGISWTISSFAHLQIAPGTLFLIQALFTITACLMLKIGKKKPFYKGLHLYSI